MNAGPRASSACVLPVPAGPAIEWLAGRITDGELLLQRGPPEVVFVVDLPDLAAYRGVLRAARHWHAQGARALIARTFNPLVARHMRRWGCLAGTVEHTTPPACRYITPPEVFAAWVGKSAQNRNAAPLGTTAR